jgi:hypothetical protein
MDEITEWEAQLNAAETLSTEAMATIVARRRLMELEIGYFTLEFVCINGRETREALLRAIEQVGEEIQDVYMPRQALVQFVDDLMQVSTWKESFWKKLVRVFLRLLSTFWKHVRQFVGLFLLLSNRGSSSLPRRHMEWR